MAVLVAAAAAAIVDAGKHNESKISSAASFDRRSLTPWGSKLRTRARGAKAGIGGGSHIGVSATLTGEYAVSVRLSSPVVCGSAALESSSSASSDDDGESGFGSSWCRNVQTLSIPGFIVARQPERPRSKRQQREGPTSVPSTTMQSGLGERSSAAAAAEPQQRPPEEDASATSSAPGEGAKSSLCRRGQSVPQSVTGHRARPPSERGHLSGPTTRPLTMEQPTVLLGSFWSSSCRFGQYLLNFGQYLLQPARPFEASGQRSGPTKRQRATS